MQYVLTLSFLPPRQEKAGHVPPSRPKHQTPNTQMSKYIIPTIQKIKISNDATMVKGQTAILDQTLHHRRNSHSARRRNAATANTRTRNPLTGPSACYMQLNANLQSLPTRVSQNAGTLFLKGTRSKSQDPRHCRPWKECVQQETQVSRVLGFLIRFFSMRNYRNQWQRRTLCWLCEGFIILRGSSGGLD